MSDLRVGAGISVASETSRAVEEAVRAAQQGLGGLDPRLAVLTATVDHDAARVQAEMQRVLPGVPIHGATTSLGVLHIGGVAAGTSGAVGVLLLASQQGVRFATGSAVMGTSGREAGRKAAQVLADKGHGGKPSVLWIAASPGNEEDVLAGVGDVFPSVPVFGGSAADHTIEGAWKVFTEDGAVSGGVSLAGLFGDVRIGAAIAGPYSPSDARAVITNADGRTIKTLADRPAATVLHEWVGDAIADQVREGGNLLVQTALTPLGIARRGTEGDYYVLLHPAQAHTDGRVDVFARAQTGDILCLMRGTQESLVGVVDTLVDQSLVRGGMKPEDVRGAMLIYCAGCAGAVGSGLDTALARVRARLGNVPLIGRCTFGEQGFVPGVGNVHTNLSVALVLLG